MLSSVQPKIANGFLLALVQSSSKAKLPKNVALTTVASTDFPSSKVIKPKNFVQTFVSWIRQPKELKALEEKFPDFDRSTLKSMLA